MSMQIKQAVNQVRLTNVAIVRIKRGGKRYEIACYKNKVVNWRNGVETDIDEVLQIDRVFHNVSKGVVANAKELQDAFGTSDQEAVCRIILTQGVFQVSDKERDVQFQNTFRDIATIVTEKTINPQTGRPYPPSTIEAAMRDTIHYAVVPSKSAKQQALDVIRQLKEVIPLERAKMRVKLSVSKNPQAIAELTSKLSSLYAAIEKEEQHQSGEFTQHIVVALVDPGHYRVLEEFIAGIPGGALEVQEFSVQKEQREVDVATEHRGTVSATPTSADDVKSTSNGRDVDAAKGAQTDTNEGADDDHQPMDAYDEMISKMSKKKLNKKKLKKLERRKGAAARLVADAVADAESENTNGDTVETTTMHDTTQSTSTAALDLAKKLAEANMKGETNEDDTRVVDSQSPPGNPVQRNATVSAAAGSGLKCSTCQVSFGSDRSMQSEHYRSDVHRLNLKLKSKKLPPVSPEEFEFMGPDEIDAIMHDYRVD